MRASRLVVYAALCASAWCLAAVALAQPAAPTPAAVPTSIAAPAQQGNQVKTVPATSSLPSALSAEQGNQVKTVPTSSSRTAEGDLPPRRALWDYVKVLPIFFYTPETSAGFGAGLLVQFDLPGVKSGRRPSSITLGSVYTLNKQILGQFTPELRFKNDDFVLKLDVIGARYPNRFYGIGNETRASVYDTYTDCYLRAEFDARMRPFAEGSALRPVFLGINQASAWSTMRNAEPSSDQHKSVFASIHDRGEKDVMAVGIGPSAAWDSRDSLNWPRRGAFLDVKSTFFEPGLGGNVRYRRLSLDLRRYQALWLEHVLALRFVAQAAWGQVPFQRLPQLGGATLFRGWYGGQLRQRLLMAVEAEYRLPITRRWAMVAFGSVGRVARNVTHFDVREVHVAGGGGLRFSVDKRDRVNIRLDLAYGDAFYPYLQFREAF